MWVTGTSWAPATLRLRSGSPRRFRGLAPARQGFLRTTWRKGWAIWPGDSIPVATWYRSGWKRWWLRRSIRGDLDGLVPEVPDGGQAAEISSYDDHPMAGDLFLLIHR